ncbi:hypothetical protein KIM67_17065 [Flagellimonas sp. 389]|uniref:hypothetical protein n=1 Tax=Flagellimonas sp. 389 TaxID=2835862 RepID=UPI001BD41F3B|nr:hypothetical protein [Flagellimonas sp. 389]MBS9464136.1 hypothetical protein [Flagellimonas sp. 389]
MKTLVPKSFTDPHKVIRPLTYFFLLLVLSLFTFNSCGKDDTCTEKKWYQNLDGDSEGNDKVTLLSCDKPNDYIDVGGDPDDTNANITSNCEQMTYYADQDEDGYGDPNNSITQCSGVDIPVGYVGDNTDCNDEDPGKTIIGATLYADTDGDGYGDPDFPIIAETCDDFMGNVLDNTDCDDTDGDNYPGSQYMVYQDNDNDGLGNPEVSQTVAGCTSVPEGYVKDNTDCNDLIAGPLFVAADWVGTFDVKRTYYDGDGVISFLNFECMIEIVEGQPNSLKLIGFWNPAYPESTLTISVDPCTQKATWNEDIAIGYYPSEPYMGDIHWERADYGSYATHNITVDPQDAYGWCTLDPDNKTIELWGVSRIPDHGVYFGHYLCELSPHVED